MYMGNIKPDHLGQQKMLGVSKYERLDRMDNYSGKALQQVSGSMNTLRWAFSTNRPWKDLFNSGAMKLTKSKSYQKPSGSLRCDHVSVPHSQVLK